jgi:hypothetical protein
MKNSKITNIDLNIKNYILSDKPKDLRNSNLKTMYIFKKNIRKIQVIIYMLYAFDD